MNLNLTIKEVTLSLEMFAKAIQFNVLCRKRQLSQKKEQEVECVKSYVPKQKRTFKKIK
jgi:hypothetical protein